MAEVTRPTVFQKVAAKMRRNSDALSRVTRNSLTNFLIFVFLSSLMLAATMAYSHTGHRHVHGKRADVQRAPAANSDGDAGNTASAVGFASSDGDVFRLRTLFARGASANAMYENGSQPLILAADGAHADAVRLLIAHGAYLFGADNGGNSALDSAEARKRYTTDPVLRAKYGMVIAVLINAGAEAQDQAVLEAARQGDTVRLQKLFARNARVNFPLGNPLVLAAQGAHVGAVRVLLKTGDAPFFRPAPNGATVLDDAEIQQRRASDPAARAKYAQIITLLKNVGALEADQRAELNAVNEGNVVRLQMLFAHGATANFVDRDGQTPLMCAAEGAQVEAAQFLLAHGANVNARDRAGRTSLDIAAFWAKERPDPVLRPKYAQIIALLVNTEGKSLPKIL